MIRLNHYLATEEDALALCTHRPDGFGDLNLMITRCEIAGGNGLGGEPVNSVAVNFYENWLPMVRLNFEIPVVRMIGK